VDVAQKLPFGVVVVDTSKITHALNESSVFYVGGPLDNQFVGFRTK
jgi:hypothetical protein